MAEHGHLGRGLLGRGDVLDKGRQAALAGSGLDRGGRKADGDGLAVLAYQAGVHLDVRAIAGYDLLDGGIEGGLLLRVEVAEELAPGEFGPGISRQSAEGVVRGQVEVRV